jgi:hypothetical protein
LLQRCSRPLCRSQTTHPPTTTRTHHAHEGRRRPQATNQPADPSGPNSVPNHPHRSPTHHVPHPPTPPQKRACETGSTSASGTTTGVLHRRFH